MNRPPSTTPPPAVIASFQSFRPFLTEPILQELNRELNSLQPLIKAGQEQGSNNKIPVPLSSDFKMTLSNLIRIAENLGKGVQSIPQSEKNLNDESLLSKAGKSKQARQKEPVFNFAKPRNDRRAVSANKKPNSFLFKMQQDDSVNFEVIPPLARSIPGKMNVSAAGKAEQSKSKSSSSLKSLVKAQDSVISRVK